MLQSNDDIIKKKLDDTQAMIRDYKMYSKQLDNPDLSQAFKQFAKESSKQARTLELFLDYKKILPYE